MTDALWRHFNYDEKFFVVQRYVMNLNAVNSNLCFATVMPCLALFGIVSCWRPQAIANPSTNDVGSLTDARAETEDAEQTGTDLAAASDTQIIEDDAAIVCQADCEAKVCGTDGCGGSCGLCEGAQDLCVDGACVCQPDCVNKNCGTDGCGGSCGSCHVTTQICSSTQNCVDAPCETAVCGVCDEIDISTIAAVFGSLGADHGNLPITTAVFRDWPITTELEVEFPAGAGARFTINHFPGESWSIYEGSTMEGAGMVACWDKVGSGINCLNWDWWTMGNGGYKSFDWPIGRPVAHMLFSVADQKRTNIRYFESWPYNNVVRPDVYNTDTVGTGMLRRNCR
jgi:hypothetical protein